MNTKKLMGLALVCKLALTACAVGSDSPNLGGSDHPLAIEDEAGFLRFMNDRQFTTVERLDDECGIRSDSARFIIRHRDGRPNQPAVNDFDSVDELLSVHMVGPWTVQQLYECATLFGYIHEGAWTTLLEVSQRGSSYAQVVAWGEDRAAVFGQTWIDTQNGREPASFFRAYESGQWTWPIRLDGGLPEYACSYGAAVKAVFDHYLVRLPNDSSTGAPRLVAGVIGRYSTAQLNSEGLLYALFVRTFDGTNWGPWYRVTPVGHVFDASVAADSEGTVWFAWKSSTNVNGGTVFLSSFDPSTGSIGQLEAVDGASQQLGFDTVRVTPTPSGDIWVTYQAPEGGFARMRRTGGQWEPRIPIPGAVIPHDTAWADGTLWVVTGGFSAVNLYSLSGTGFVHDAPPLFVSESTETNEEIEATTYSDPVIAPHPDGGLVVAAARTYHYENFADPSRDTDQAALVVLVRYPSGSRSEAQTVYTRSWNNVGGAMVSAQDSIWIVGSDMDTLFVLQQEL